VSDGEQPKGAYGLELKGLTAHELLVPIPKGKWPLVEVHPEPARAVAKPTRIGRDRARIALGGGEYVLIARQRRSAAFATDPDADEGRLIHPFLSTVGSVFAWWHGHEALHSGAFVVGDGAWALVGAGGSGKSSLLAGLALADYEILTDDLLVLNGEIAFAGPRCVDLREAASEALGLEGHTEPARWGQRERLRLGPVKPELPLRGWISLTWGGSLRVRELGAAERLERLSAERNTGRLLQLVRLPAWELTRPDDWRSLEVAVEVLRDLTDA
jgi:hypothetical protein